MDVKSADQAAKDYVQDLYSDNNLRDLMLEEIEISEGSDEWLVTVGFSLSESKDDSAALITPSRKSRSLSRRYKIINVDAKTGQPISMKIRPV